MARSPVLNRDELRIRVVDAVRAIGERAEAPTVSRVRAWLVANYGNAGAQDILQVVVREVMADILSAEEVEDPALPTPAEIETMAAASARMIWRKAAQLAASEYEARRLSAGREIADSVTARELAERQFVDLERERDRLDLELEAAKTEIAALGGKLVAAEVRMDEQRKRSDAMEHELRSQIGAGSAPGPAAEDAIRKMSAKIDKLINRGLVPAGRRRSPPGGV